MLTLEVLDKTGGNPRTWHNREIYLFLKSSWSILSTVCGYSSIQRYSNNNKNNLHKTAARFDLIFISAVSDMGKNILCFMHIYIFFVNNLQNLHIVVFSKSWDVPFVKPNCISWKQNKLPFFYFVSFLFLMS